MKNIAAFVLTCALVGCSSSPQTVPIVEKPSATALLAKPPADAMVPPVEPTPLETGSTISENTEIMRRNNLNALKDRTNLITLQAYIRGIFSEDK